MADKIFTVDVDNYIEKRFWDGKFPHIRNRRVRVAWIAEYSHDNQRSIAEIAQDIGLTEMQVAAALLYYEQHKEEIDILEQAEYEEYKHLYED